MNESSRTVPTFMSTAGQNPFAKVTAVLVILLILPAIDTLSDTYPQTYGLVIGGCTLLAVALSIVWYSRLRRLFVDGVTLEATIYDLYRMYRNDTLRVKFSYYVDDERYEQARRIPMTDENQDLDAGAVIRVLVDPDHPKRCWVMDL